MDLVLLFDIDGTLTPPRRDLNREMAEALAGLAVPFHVAAGSDLPLIEHQFLEPLWKSGFRGDFDAFMGNGATHCRCRFSHGYDVEVVEQFDFAAHLGPRRHALLLEILRDVVSQGDLALPASQKVVGDQLIDRGSMLNFAPCGRERGRVSEAGREARAQFVRFDRSTGYRERVRAELEDRLSELVSESGLVVMLGGETSFDLVIEGKDKSNAIERLLQRGARRIVFLGDALFEGGNDYPILRWVESWQGEGPCPVEAIRVDGWRETLRTFGERGWLAEKAG